MYPDAKHLFVHLLKQAYFRFECIKNLFPFGEPFFYLFQFFTLASQFYFFGSFKAVAKGSHCILPAIFNSRASLASETVILRLRDMERRYSASKESIRSFTSRLAVIKT